MVEGWLYQPLPTSSPLLSPHLLSRWNQQGLRRLLLLPFSLSFSSWWWRRRRREREKDKKKTLKGTLPDFWPCHTESLFFKAETFWSAKSVRFVLVRVWSGFPIYFRKTCALRCSLHLDEATKKSGRGREREKESTFHSLERRESYWRRRLPRRNKKQIYIGIYIYIWEMIRTRLFLLAHFLPSRQFKTQKNPPEVKKAGDPKNWGFLLRLEKKAHLFPG